MSSPTDPRLAQPPRAVPGPGEDADGIRPGEAGQAEVPFDPLRLCIFATVALLGWLAGPVAVLVFAGVGFAGYWRARQAGLTRSKCYLRDTRLVLLYLAALAVAAVVALGFEVARWL